MFLCLPKYQETIVGQQSRSKLKSGRLKLKIDFEISYRRVNKYIFRNMSCVRVVTELSKLQLVLFYLI